MQGIVFDTKRFALHDGPGIRTTVFLKGCPLRCQWCQNPESFQPKPEMFFSANLCTKCGMCEKVCPEGAVKFVGDKRKYFREICELCGKCSSRCPSGALNLVGEIMEANEVVDIILRDKPFYDNSGGGVTISGGEPLAQKDFSKAILKLCKHHDLHTCLDTSGYCKWGDLVEVLAYVDLVFVDIKVMDSQRHRNLTGLSNELILENALRFLKTSVEIIVRVPVIPGINDDEANFEELARFVSKMNNLRAIELLPYNSLAEAKYARLGLRYPLAGLKNNKKEDITKIEGHLASSGCVVTTVWGLGPP